MRVNKHEFLIGADPECFIREKATGKLVSAHGMLPGDKENPYPVQYGAVQVDGMAAEFNIEPARTKKSFIRNVKAVLATIQEMIGDEYELVFESVADFGKEMIAAQPFEARELGCDPDFNAWNQGKVNPVPDVDTPFRTGAGHIHIGWTTGADIEDKNHLEMCIHVIKNLDMGTLHAHKLDTDPRRRELYGKAGAFRPKSYGVEYRTPSNAWLKNEKTMGLMYDTVINTLKHLVKHGEVPVTPQARLYVLDNLNESFSRAMWNSTVALLDDTLHFTGDYYV